MNYDNPGDSDLYPPRDDHERHNHSYDNGWDDAPTQDTNSGFNFPPYTSSSLMDVSPDASFSALDPNSILSRRHVPLPVSRPTTIAPDANTSRLQSEIFNVTNTQKNLSAQLGPSPTFYHPNGSSRLDYIWSSPGFPAPGLFSQVETCPKLNDNQFTDHRVLITAFDFSSCFATLSKARLKQKSEQRTIFLYKNLNEDIWDTFSNE
ncbi:hypothetical protein RhiirB3_396463, partial [Rhizophagus irregularis]